MKLHLTSAENNYLITACGTQFVEVNKQQFTSSLLVMPQQLINDWGVANFAELNEAHLEKIAAFNPEVVLLGTGEKHQFLHPNITKSLMVKGIPLECMTTAAACRTYNILMSEGRNVLAALIVENQ